MTIVDSGLDSELIQDDVQFDNGNNAPTVEDGTNQDDFKNGQLGNTRFISTLFCLFVLTLLPLTLFVLIHFVADADLGDESGTADHG